MSTVTLKYPSGRFDPLVHYVCFYLCSCKSQESQYKTFNLNKQINFVKKFFNKYPTSFDSCLDTMLEHSSCSLFFGTVGLHHEFLHP